MNEVSRLYYIATSPQNIYENVKDVVASNEAVASSSAPLQALKRRGRPPNQELNHPRQHKSLQRNHRALLEGIITGKERTFEF